MLESCGLSLSVAVWWVCGVALVIGEQKRRESKKPAAAWQVTPRLMTLLISTKSYLNY